MVVSHFEVNRHEKKIKKYFGQFSAKLQLFPVKMSLRTSKSDCGKSTFFEIQNLTDFDPNLGDLPSFAGTRLNEYPLVNLG